MAETSDQLETKITSLQNAIDSGVLTVRHGETSTTYKSTAEMMKALSEMQRRLAGLNGTTRQRVYYPWQSSKGL